MRNKNSHLSLQKYLFYNMNVKWEQGYSTGLDRVIP